MNCSDVDQDRLMVLLRAAAAGWIMALSLPCFWPNLFWCKYMHASLRPPCIQSIQVLSELGAWRGVSRSISVDSMLTTGCFTVQHHTHNTEHVVNMPHVQRHGHIEARGGCRASTLPRKCRFDDWRWQ
jgi:hypothetical protein